MSNPDEIRTNVLQRVERTEQRFRLAFFGGVLVEALFLAAFLLLADLSNRLHVLLLLSTIAVYTIIVLGLVALGAHANRNTMRVLSAMEPTSR